jgi:hypothetical protein
MPQRPLPKIDAGVSAESPIKFLPGFSENQENEVYDTLQSIRESEPCAQAWAKYRGFTPGDLIDKGLLLGLAVLLRGSNQQIGITEASRARHASIVGSVSVQAVTIRNWPGYTNELLSDSRARVLLNLSAFGGGKYSLREVLVHELLHVSGWRGEVPGPWATLMGATDLSHFKDYEKIMDACD